MPKKILVIDDEPDVVELLTDILVEQGFEVLSAANGKIALTVLQQNRPDLILLDVEMPEETGAGFYRQLVHKKDTRDIPVIIVSGYHSRRIAVSKGVPVIDKPIEEEQLLGEINRMLN